jgi:hypothetical protein
VVIYVNEVSFAITLDDGVGGGTRRGKGNSSSDSVATA